MARDYIGHGVRARAQALVTLELGPENDLERIQKLLNEVDHKRFTRLDRALLAKAKERLRSRLGLGPSRPTRVEWSSGRSGRHAQPGPWIAVADWDGACEQARPWRADGTRVLSADFAWQRSLRNASARGSQAPRCGHEPVRQPTSLRRGYTLADTGLLLLAIQNASTGASA